MKAKFVDVDTIVLFPEGEEENMIFQRFVSLVESNQYTMASCGSVFQDSKYVNFKFKLIGK